MFTHVKNTVTTGNPTWSVRTPYTSLTGINSEVQPAAHARNSFIKRNISDTLNTVESIHKKDLQSMAFRRKSVENSMMAYSEKVKSLNQQRLPHMQAKPSDESDEQLVRKFSTSGTRDELFGRNAILPPINITRRDNELERIKLSISDSLDSKVRDSHNLSDGSRLNHRSRRFGVYEKPEKIDEDKENSFSQEQNVSIAPFPERSKSFLRSEAATDFDGEYVHRETPAPFIKPGYWSYRLHAQHPKKQLPMLTTENKRSHGRRSKRGSRPIVKFPEKPYHQIFTYSSAIQTAIFGLEGSSLVIDKKKNIFHSKADLEPIDINEVRMAHSLRSIQECIEPEPVQV
ncbi:hypothetical protein Bpfe_023451 [Biomphalaria pfeifferi]|uniref:Uncharacterized protein n=1 Tax=Biomphalaria pfeifferi TaxID=112525 RepID=A0AAD8F0X2_BIOPF|nr:hypothetical protein Bpfe_023451 [Biomphalaria pfeifferi]